MACASFPSATYPSGTMTTAVSPALAAYAAAAAEVLPVEAQMTARLPSSIAFAMVGHQHDLGILDPWIANHHTLLLDDGCDANASLTQRNGDLRKHAGLVLGEQTQVVSCAHFVHRPKPYLLVMGEGRDHPRGTPP